MDGKGLYYFTREKLLKTFFSDESTFTVEGRYNAHNDVFYAREKRKGEVDEERLHHGKSSFPQSVMVSAGISCLGKTSLYLIEREAKVDSEYYCQCLLSQMIPETTALPGKRKLFRYKVILLTGSCNFRI